MAIEHLVPSSRLTKGWFLRRFFWQGISDAVMHLIDERPSRGERLRLALSRSIRTMRSPNIGKALMIGQEAEAFKAMCLALIDVGFVLGMLGFAKR
jgi:hypothetical protein